MKHRTGKFKSISTFFLFLIGIAFSASIVGAFSHPEASWKRLNNEAGVKMSAQYLPQESDDQNETTFKINLSTHYVDLSGYDLKDISFVTIDGGPQQQATEWVASGDNHHVQGILRFAGHQLHDSSRVQLIVTGIGNSEDRVFEWNGPVK
jgi:hypothetical protein